MKLSSWPHESDGQLMISVERCLKSSAPHIYLNVSISTLLNGKYRDRMSER